MLTKKERTGKRLLIASLIFCFLSVVCLIAAKRVESVTYRKYITISAATATEDKKASYLSAIRLSPQKPEAYTLLLEIYNEDGVFEQKESEEFLSLYNKHHNQFRKNKAYAELHYQAGLFYVNGFDGNAARRMKMAMPFIDEAKQTMNSDNTTIDCYWKICTYYKDYIWDKTTIREVSAEQISMLINEIQNTIDGFQESNNPENIYEKLGFYVAVCDLFYEQRDTFAATVDESAILHILDSIYEEIPDIQSLLKEQTKNLAKTLTDNENIYRDMIQRAYQRGGT